MKLSTGLTCNLPLLIILSTIIPTALAESIAFPDMKPTGISVEWYQHELDLNVTQIQATIPGINPADLDAIKGQLNSLNKAKVVNLRLDRQINPNFNIYGAIGKVTDTTSVGFSGLNPALSDMVLDKEGTAYTVGGTFTKNVGKVLASIQFLHSRIDFDDDAEVTVSTAIPAIGLPTSIGVVNFSVAYQAIEADYSGTITAPVVGAIPVNVKTENADKVQALIGLNSRIAKDLYVTANVGLNGQEQVQLQINKRF